MSRRVRWFSSGWLALVWCALLIVDAGAKEASGGTNVVARGLITRMLDARNGSVAPKKAMWLAAEQQGEKIDWPFDVARIERLFEKQLVLAGDGAFALRRDATNSVADEVKSDQALRYVNKVMCEWAVMELDRKFERLDAVLIRRLAVYREDLDPNFWGRFAIITNQGVEGGGASMRGGWVTGWKIRPQLYLLLTADLKSAGCPRDYQFVMWDGKQGKDWPMAGFVQLPNAAQASTVIRALGSASAANNLAVMLHSREANRTTYMAPYVETLLRRAAGGGCEQSYHNLGVLAEERGDTEQAAAFYSRETNREANR